MTDQHLDLDALADVLAGEPAAHLSTCAACSTALAKLETALGLVQESLKTLPDVALPEAVADRITAALLAERSTGPLDGPVDEPVEAPAAQRSATVTPLAARRSGPARWLPIASGIAAAAALVFGAVVLLPNGGTSNDRDRSTSVEAAGGGGISSSSTGNDYRKDGVALRQALPGLLSGASKRSAAGPAVDASGQAAPHSDTTAQLQAVDALAPLRDPKTLAACLASLTEAGDPGIPLALDYASYEGQPALIVVLPATKPDKVDVFVVGVGCSQADATVLSFFRLPKPT